ncbi:MAG: EAL domain-containing protein [Oscillospiraceae bacterium]|nr:EAL domain-containing protein [Oscillospiraceae bacterium]
MSSNGKLFGCEILLRYWHKRYGSIPPYAILTISEEAGSDDKLNEWIFATALDDCKRIFDCGFTDLVISINISPVQLKNETIFNILEEKLREHKMNPDLIEIELTENISIEESDEINKVFARLKSIGVRLAIDDFGMGHTSLTYLRSYDFDTVKLDGILIEDIHKNESSANIVKSVIDLANSLDIHVVAECVENIEQIDKLNELGCHIYQGYYYSKPLQLDQFLDYARTNIVSKEAAD